MCDISGEEKLYRRVAKEFLTRDNRLSSAAFETFRVSSSNFDNFNLSVDLASLINKPADCLAKYPDQGLVFFLAADAIRESLCVRADPLQENHAHAIIPGKKTKKIKKALATASCWEIAVKGYKIFCPKSLVRE